jgi:hypothetical protein
VVEIRPYNRRRDGSIADMLWRDPAGDDLPSLPTEWTPLSDFLRQWAARYADRRVSTFAHDSNVRSSLAQRAYTWGFRHLIEALDEVGVADRQADGTFKPVAINRRARYRMRRNALERLASSMVGRSLPERGAVVAEVFEDPHIRRRLKTDEDAAPVAEPAYAVPAVAKSGDAGVSQPKARRARRTGTTAKSAEAKSDIEGEAIVKAMTARMARIQRARIKGRKQVYSFDGLRGKLCEEMGDKLPPRDTVLRPAWYRLPAKLRRGVGQITKTTRRNKQNARRPRPK